VRIGGIGDAEAERPMAAAVSGVTAVPSDGRDQTLRLHPIFRGFLAF